MYVSSINRNTQIGLPHSEHESRQHRADGTTAPVNVWGDKLFLVKFQAGMGPAGYRPQHIMLYDRKRSFQLFFHRAGDPALFEDFHGEMCGPRGGHGGLKMYRYAKRTGDWELSVCLDRAPTADVKW